MNNMINLKFSVINNSGSKLQSDGEPYPKSDKWTVAPQNIASGEQFGSGINGFATGEIAALGYVNSATVSVKLLSSGTLEPTITPKSKATCAITGNQITFTIIK
jgi:hypothetical protein